MGDFGPRFNDIDTLIGFVEHANRNGLQFIGHGNDGNSGIPLVTSVDIVNLQLQVEVAIGMLHLQGGCLNGVNRAKCGHGREVQVVAGIT